MSMKNRVSEVLYHHLILQTVTGLVETQPRRFWDRQKSSNHFCLTAFDLCKINAPPLLT